MGKTIRFILLLGITILVFNGCTMNISNYKSPMDNSKTSNITNGGTLTMPISAEPDSLNPLFCRDRVAYRIINALFDPLFIVDGEETRYYLASNLDISKDMLTYTIKLRDNLKWHDGTAITADDLIFTIEKILDEKENIHLRGNFLIDNTPVKTRKIDNLTVEFKLPHVYTPFKYNLNHLIIIPKHVFAEKRDISSMEVTVENTIGSGPYTFKSWTKGETIVVKKFDNYYRQPAHIEEIVFCKMLDDEVLNKEMESGTPIATYVSDKEYLHDKHDQRYNAYNFDEGMLNYIMINTKGNELLSNPKVRQAICYALNRDKILQMSHIGAEFCHKAYSSFSPSTLYYTNDIEKYETNINKAKQLLKEAKVKNGQIDFSYIRENEQAEKIAASVKEQLGEIGLNVKLVPIDRKTYVEIFTGVSERKFDLMTNSYIMGEEPSSYKDVYMTGAVFNVFNYSNEKVDNMFIQANKELNNAKREELYKKIQKIISEDAIIYPIDYETSHVITPKNLAGVEEAKLVPIYMFEDLSKLYFTE